MLRIEDIHEYNSRTREAIIKMMVSDGVQKATTAFTKKRETVEDMINQIVSDNEVMGIEFRHHGDLKRWAAITPETHPDAGGPIRLVFFDERGFSGHLTQVNMTNAVRELVNSGYVLEDRGAMKRIKFN